MSVFGFLNAFAMDDFLLDLAMIQLKGTSVACLAFGGKNREKMKKRLLCCPIISAFLTKVSAITTTR